MDISKVPKTEVLGRTASAAQAAMWLAQVLLPGGAFTHFEPVYGADRSGRVLYQQRTPNSARFPHPFSEVEIMVEFERLKHEMRYRPREVSDQRRGWSVETAMIDGKPAAIVWCDWVM